MQSYIRIVVCVHFWEQVSVLVCCQEGRGALATHLDTLAEPGQTLGSPPEPTCQAPPMLCAWLMDLQPGTKRVPDPPEYTGGSPESLI